MNLPRIRNFLLLFAAGFVVAADAPAFAADALRWRRAPDQVDADIDGWALPRLLEEVSAATGWAVFTQPDTALKRPISVRFKNLTAGEALGKLLGDLNYALLPQTNGPARLLVFRTTKADATQPVRVRERLRPGKPIPDELVVTVKRGTDIDELARKLGAKVVNRADDLNAARLKFTDGNAAAAARETLAGSDNATADANYSVPRPQPDTAGTGASTTALNLKPGAGPDSSRFIIGLVDTPVQNVGAPYSQFLLPALSVTGTTPVDTGSALPTHGTSMLETVLRGLEQTPGAIATTSVRILPVDVYGSAESTTTFEVARGVKAAIEGGASIVNLPLGGTGDSALLHNVIMQGFDRGVLFVAAAGNEATTTPTYPAAYAEVLAVTARDRSGNIASYANYGSFVDVAAPGTSLVTYNGRSFFVTGTSASTSYISGYAAGLATTTGRTPIAAAKSLIPDFSVENLKRP